MNNSPSYTLDVSGTLGVTGAITLSNLGSVGTGVVVTSNTGLLSTATGVNQTGFMGSGSTTNQTTNSVGEITINHGLSFTPTMSFANLPASTVNVINVKSVSSTQIVFIIRDAATGSPLNGGSVSKIEWLAIK